jgi:hypothetical protein
VFRIIVALMVGASPLAVAAATCGSDLRGAQTLESADYVIAYRTQPPKIAVGKHFSLDIVTCAKGGAPDPVNVAVDAFMPEHGHGMNYKAVVKAAGNTQASAPVAGAHFRADGLMFHMPGRWDLYFDVQGAGRTERLTRSIVLE